MSSPVGLGEEQGYTWRWTRVYAPEEDSSGARYGDLIPAVERPGHHFDFLHKEIESQEG